MLFITIIILIVAKALPVLNTHITLHMLSRFTSLSSIFSRLINFLGISKREEAVKEKFFISRSSPLYNPTYKERVTAPNRPATNTKISSDATGFNFSSLSIHRNPGIFTLIKLLLLSLLILQFMGLVLSLINLYPIESPMDIGLNMVSNSSNVPSPASDPVRWRPSGVSQGASVTAAGIATYVALFKIGGLPPRVRAILSLGVAGLSATAITVHTALENPLGFNRLMWEISEYTKTQQWPSIDLAYIKNEEKLKEFVTNQMKTLTAAPQGGVNSTVKDVASSSTTTNNFLPSSDAVSDLLIKLYENLFRVVMQLLQPGVVQGHLDDLIGQRMFLDFILFVSCILVGILFIIFIFNLIFVFNKDRIMNLFKNKFIIWFLKYEAFVSRITLFYIPIFILMGLFTIAHGLSWQLTHPIPYEAIFSHGDPIDLHQFISSDEVKTLPPKLDALNK